MLNGQTFSSRTGKTSGLPKFELSGKQVKTVIGIILYLIAAKMIWDLLK
jgi:hypothetical protein